MGKKKLIKAAIKVGGDLLMTDKAQKFLCGTYSDGTIRSLPDALNEEFISPSDRESWELMKLQKRGLLHPGIMLDNISSLSQLPKDLTKPDKKKKSKKKKKKNKKKIKDSFYKEF